VLLLLLVRSTDLGQGSKHSRGEAYPALGSGSNRPMGLVWVESSRQIVCRGNRSLFSRRRCRRIGLRDGIGGGFTGYEAGAAAEGQIFESPLYETLTRL